MSEDLTTKLPQTDSEKLALVLSTIQALAVRVDNFEQTVKVRLYDPQPFLQKVLADIARLQDGQQQLHEGQQRLEEGQQRLEEGQEVLRSEFEALKRSVNHRFLILSGQAQVSIRNLDRRITRLELDSNPPNSQT